jgi:hypothetical protein
LGARGSVSDPSDPSDPSHPNTEHPRPNAYTPMLTEYLKETEQLAERVDELGRHL